MPPHFHRQIKDVSVAIYLLNVVDYKMAIHSFYPCTHAHLPHDFAAPPLKRQSASPFPDSGLGHITCSGL